MYALQARRALADACGCRHSVRRAIPRSRRVCHIAIAEVPLSASLRASPGLASLKSDRRAPPEGSRIELRHQARRRLVELFSGGWGIQSRGKTFSYHWADFAARVLSPLPCWCAHLVLLSSTPLTRDSLMEGVIPGLAHRGRDWKTLNRSERFVPFPIFVPLHRYQSNAPWIHRAGKMQLKGARPSFKN